MYSYSQQPFKSYILRNSMEPKEETTNLVITEETATELDNVFDEKEKRCFPGGDAGPGRRTWCPHLRV